jgi:hypothetical protein
MIDKPIVERLGHRRRQKGGVRGALMALKESLELPEQLVDVEP